MPLTAAPPPQLAASAAAAAAVLTKKKGGFPRNVFKDSGLIFRRQHFRFRPPGPFDFYFPASGKSRVVTGRCRLFPPVLAFSFYRT